MTYLPYSNPCPLKHFTTRINEKALYDILDDVASSFFCISIPCCILDESQETRTAQGGTAASVTSVSLHDVKDATPSATNARIENCIAKPKGSDVALCRSRICLKSRLEHAITMSARDSPLNMD